MWIKSSSEASHEPSNESNFHLKVHMKLQMSLFFTWRFTERFTRAGTLHAYSTLRKLPIGCFYISDSILTTLHTAWCWQACDTVTRVPWNGFAAVLVSLRLYNTVSVVWGLGVLRHHEATDHSLHIILSLSFGNNRCKLEMVHYHNLGILHWEARHQGCRR